MYKQLTSTCKFHPLPPHLPLPSHHNKMKGKREERGRYDNNNASIIQLSPTSSPPFLSFPHYLRFFTLLPVHFYKPLLSYFLSLLIIMTSFPPRDSFFPLSPTSLPQYSATVIHIPYTTLSFSPLPHYTRSLTTLLQTPSSSHCFLYIHIPLPHVLYYTPLTPTPTFLFPSPPLLHSPILLLHCLSSPSLPCYTPLPYLLPPSFPYPHRPLSPLGL